MNPGRNIPRTRAELTTLEATYRSFDSAADWLAVGFDARRWQRHAAALRTAVETADPTLWDGVRERFLRAAAQDSSALSELIRPTRGSTTVVLESPPNVLSWSSIVEASSVIVECHRQALARAAEAVGTNQPVDAQMIGDLQDLIVSSQQTYTVRNPDGSETEADLPRRQYKPMTNYLVRTDRQLMPFAPAELVAAEMERLATELRSAEFARLHPLLQAVYSHLAVITIHPFADGNGRLARTLASMPLLRSTGLPLLILADQWPAYIDALERCDIGDRTGLIDLVVAAHINAMDLATHLISVGASGGGRTRPSILSPERTLLDLVAVHLRQLLGAPGADQSVAVTGTPDSVRVASAGPGDETQVDLQFTVVPDDAPGWLRLVTSTGDGLDVWRNDVHPAPTEIAHLRVRSWLDQLLPRAGHGLRDSTHVRGLFVLGVPRSGTTMMGNWIGSHPSILGLAEYGGFHIAHEVAPTYINRLPGRGHDSFLLALNQLAVDHASQLARREGRTWFCDATPWNLEIAGALAASLPDAVFMLLLRHFAGAVLSLSQFPWAGASFADAAQLWVNLNIGIEQLPVERTVVVGYDAFAEHPAEVIASLREALTSLGLEADLFDDTQFATSHAHLVGKPRPTVGVVRDGDLVLRAVPSLDADRWTPEVHAEVWPVVADMHRALLAQFPDVYVAPVKPHHVVDGEW